MRHFLFKDSQLTPPHAYHPLSGHYEGIATRQEALIKLKTLNVRGYAKTRNSLHGDVSHLSVYVEHGLLDIKDFLDHIAMTDTYEEAQPLLKQLFWREFFYRPMKLILRNFGLIMSPIKQG